MNIKIAANHLKSKLQNEEPIGYYETNNGVVFVTKQKGLPVGFNIMVPSTTHYLVTPKGDIFPTNPIEEDIGNAKYHPL